MHRTGKKPMVEYPLFREKEVFKMAIEIEQHGLAFYKACLEAAKEPGVLKVFEHLICQEQKHIELLTEMSEAMDDHPVPESYPGEMRSYVNCFVKDLVYFEPLKGSKIAGEILDPACAIAVGTEFEKRSILFYTAMKQVVHFSDADSIDRLIAEELYHIRRLQLLRLELESS